MNKEIKPKKNKSFFPFKTGAKYLDSTVEELSQMGLHVYEEFSVITGLLISSDKNYLVTWCSFEGALLIWNIPNQVVHYKIKLTSGILAAKFTPNGNYLIISTGDNELKVYNIQRFREYFTFHLKHKLFQLQTTENDYFYGIDITNSILIGDIPNKKITNEINAGPYDIKSFDVCCSKNLLAFGTRSGFVAIKDLETEVNIFEHEGQRTCIICIKFHPIDPLVFISSMDSTIKVFSYASKPATIFHIFTTKAYIWDFYLTDKQVISRSQANRIEKWEFSQPESEIVKTEGKITSFCLSSDKTLLLYSKSKCSVIGIDLHSQLKLFEIGLHSKKITAILPWERKKYIVTASKDKSIRVWNFLTFKCVAVHKLHNKGVCSLALSKQGRFLVSCGFELKIIVFRH